MYSPRNQTQVLHVPLPPSRPLALEYVCRHRQAVGYKDKGNACIAAGDSVGALKHYERGIKIVETLGSDDQAKAVLMSLRLNLALACTKEERYFDAVGAASKVLEADPANVKVSC